MGGKKAAKRGTGPKTPAAAPAHTITPGPIVPNLRQPPQIIADTLLAHLERYRDKGRLLRKPSTRSLWRTTYLPNFAARIVLSYWATALAPTHRIACLATPVFSTQKRTAWRAERAFPWRPQVSVYVQKNSSPWWPNEWRTPTRGTQWRASERRSGRG